MRIGTVPLRRIAWRDRRFAFSRGGPSAALRDSIDRVGLLTSPDLLDCGGRLVVIRGLRRLQALRLLGHAAVEARIFGEEEIAPLEAWSLNFFDNIALRDLNPAEVCTAVGQLAALGLAPERIVREYFPLLGLPPREKVFEDCLRVAGLPDTFLEALAGRTVTMAAAVFLSALGDGDRRAALRFLRRFPLTFSQQREWASLVDDIAARDGESVAKVLAVASRAARLRHGPPGPSVMQVLRERRLPSLWERRRTFRSLMKKFRLPPEMQVEPHPFLEQAGLTVRFIARTPSAWNKALKVLGAMAGDDDFGRLLDFGKAEADGD